MPLYIEADEYIVFVPQNEMDEFRSITHPDITISSQEELGTTFTSLLREEIDSAGNNDRFGWYLQQFFKIEALMRSNSQRLVIWDADCVPLQPIPLFSSKGHPIYMSANEYHIPYFEMIQRLLGLNKIQKQSFVIPGFPILKQWVNEFKQYVEDRNQSAWYEAILKQTNFSLRSGFSETETLGTWVTNTYPDSWTSSSMNWERFGQSKFGYAKDFTSSELVELGIKHNLQIVSFENWDLRKTNKSSKVLSWVKNNFIKP